MENNNKNIFVLPMDNEQEELFNKIQKSDVPEHIKNFLKGIIQNPMEIDFEQIKEWNNDLKQMYSWYEINKQKAIDFQTDIVKFIIKNKKE